MYACGHSMGGALATLFAYELAQHKFAKVCTLSRVTAPARWCSSPTHCCAGGCICRLLPRCKTSASSRYGYLSRGCKRLECPEVSGAPPCSDSFAVTGAAARDFHVRLRLTARWQHSLRGEIRRAGVQCMAHLQHARHRHQVRAQQLYKQPLTLSPGPAETWHDSRKSR